MKKRLRKKLRVGVFQELGFEVRYSLPVGLSSDEQGEFLDSFIERAIEANGLLVGGCGGNPVEGFVVAQGNRASATEEQREAVLEWLKSEPRALNPEVGPLVDAWHGWDG
jgi:uncharacterized protein YggL (DUF469 family)